jgi:hypothetical protein
VWPQSLRGVEGGNQSNYHAQKTIFFSREGWLDYRSGLSELQLRAQSFRISCKSKGMNLQSIQAKSVKMRHCAGRIGGARKPGS